ncbi:sugar-binding transcriptional regulator [Desulfomarina sp.]
MTNTSSRLDDAARAAWLYYIGGNTQEEIAGKMNISRQSVQRLVSLAISERLVKVRLDHPIADCMELASRLRREHALDYTEVMPGDPGSDGAATGIAQAGAAALERYLRSKKPKIIALGTGRALKTIIDQLVSIDCARHKIVSLSGNIVPDGSVSFYNVIFNIADTVTARCFPMSLPIIATSRKERDLLHNQVMIKKTLKLAARADVAFVGIGDLGPEAPLYVDGFISKRELEKLQKAGAVGDIAGWAFDRNGELIEGIINHRVASAPIPPREKCRVIALASGTRKIEAIKAALKGNLINGLITDENTAKTLLQHKETSEK